MAFAVTVVGMIALGIPALRHLRDPPPPAPRAARLTMGVAPAEQRGPAEEMGRPSRTAFAVSPDGGTVVFSGETTAPGSRPTTRLYRRPLAEAEAVAIPGTEGASYPFFSPDGQ